MEIRERREPTSHRGRTGAPDPRTSSRLATRLVPPAYRPVLANPSFRRLLLGLAVSYLGDGMSFVAVAWLAIELAPPDSAGVWVGSAVAAYTLPGVVGALVLGRRLRRVAARRILLADNVVRLVFIGLVPVIWLTGALTSPLYVALLAVSSLLHAWGSAATYTLLAEFLPEGQRLPANTLVGSLTFAATIAGPALAGVLVTHVSAAVVLGLDALTYAVLFVVVLVTPLPGSTRWPDDAAYGRGDAAAPATDAGAEAAPSRDDHLDTAPVDTAPVDTARARGGFAILRGDRELLGLLALTWGFNLLYGPVEVALPLHVTQDLGASGTLLGLYWMLFGVGAVVGALAVGSLERLPLWPVMVAIVVGWGVMLLPFGLGAATPLTIVCFAVGGAVYGPFVALSVTLIQQRAPREHLASVLAARSAALLTAAPLGTALGGPLTSALGPRPTLGGSGLATVALGVVAALLLVVTRRGRQSSARA